MGILTDSLGEYNGEWKKGEKDGIGNERWFEDGTIFVGEYVGGVKQGVGCYHWADGSSYEGEIKEGQVLLNFIANC